MSDTSQRIKTLIEQSGKTYQELEKETNIKKSSLQRYASGVTAKIPPKALESLSLYFNVTPAYLLGLDVQSQIETLEQEIKELRIEISNASPSEKEDLEYALAIKEESYEDLVFAQQMNELGPKNNSPTELRLSEGEQMLINLFRQVPADQQELVLQMIRAALGKM